MESTKEEEEQVKNGMLRHSLILAFGGESNKLQKFIRARPRATQQGCAKCRRLPSLLSWIQPLGEIPGEGREKKKKKKEGVEYYNSLAKST